MDGAEIAKKTLVSFANDLRNAALIRARLDGITEKSFNMQAEKSIKRSMTSPSRAAEATATDRGQRKPRRIGELCTSSLQRNNNLQSNFHAMLQLFVGESQGRHVDTSLGIPFFLYEEAQDKLSSATHRSLELEVELEVTRDRVKLSEAELQYLRDTLKERRAYHEKNLTEAVRRLEEEVDFWKSQSKNEAERNSELESHMQREAERKEHLFRQQLTVKTNELQKIHESQLNVLKQSIVEEHARCSELQELVEEKILYIEKSAIRERETIEEIKEDFESRLREERFQREASHKRELGALHTRIQELTRGSVEADQKLNRVVCALSSTWTRIGIVPPLSMTNLINELILAPPNLPNGSNDPTEWISNTLTGVFALRDARDVQVGEHKIAGPHALHPSLSSGYETSGTFSMEKRILKLEEQLCLAHDMLSEKTAHPDPAGIQQVFKPGSNLRTEIHELFCLESRDCKEMATEFSVSASSRRMQEYDTSGQSHKHSHISINPVWVTQAFCLFSSMEESGSLVHREHLSARNLEENAAATAQRGSHLETIREGDGTRLRRGQVMAEGELTADIASFSEWTNLSHSALKRIDLDREGMSQNESCRGERKSRGGKERSGMERTFFKEGTEFGKSLPSSERGSTGMVAESNSDHHTLEIPQAAPLRASTTSTTTTTTTTNSLLIQDSKKTESRRSSHRRRAKLSEDSEHIHPTANPDTSKGKVIHRTLYSYSKQPRDLEQDPEKRRVETEYSDPMMKYVAQSRSETIDQVAHFFSEMLATHNRLTEACNEFRSVAVYQLNFPTIQDGDVTSWSTLSHRLLEECHFAERTLRALRKEPCFSSQGNQLSNLQRSTRNYSEDRKRGGGGLKFSHMRNLKKSVFLRRSNVIEAPHRKPVVAQTYRELVNHRSQAPNPPWANEGIFNRMNFNGFLPPLNIRPNVTRFAGNTL